MSGHGAGRLQLVAIGHSCAALARAGVEHRLTGGWAVDFLRGRVSRPHKDVDLLIWAADVAAAAKGLATVGFHRVKTAFPDERLELRRGGVDVELLFLVRDAAGRLVTPGRWCDWPWPSDTLDDRSCRIGAVTCRVVSLSAQIESKAGYEARRGCPPRSQDVHDLRLLRAIADES